MKKWRVFFCVVCIIALLASCKNDSVNEMEYAITEIESIDITEENSASAVVIKETTDNEEETTPAIQETAESTVEIVELTQTYMVSINRGDFPIYGAPGDEKPPVATVGTAGIYTIVAECKYLDGTLWGRLKSGAGWISLDFAKKI